MTADPSGDAARSGRTAGDWALVVGICLFAALAAVMAFFYLPWYVGRVPVPITVLGAGWLCWVLPRTSYRLTGSLAAAAAPVVVLFGVIVVLSVLPNSLDLLRPPRVVLAPWRWLMLLGVIALTAAASLSMLWGDRTLARTRSAGTAPDRAGAEPATGPGDTGSS